MAPSSPFVSFANFHAFALKPLCLPCTHMVLSENTSAPLNNRGGQLIGNNPPSSAGIAEVLYSDVVYPRSERCMSSVAAQSLVCLLCLSDHGVCVVFCVHLQVDLGGEKKKQLKDTMSTCKRSCITLVNRYLHCQNVTTNITFLTFIRVMMCY